MTDKSALWPTTFAATKNEATGSPLPSIWVVGEYETGKSGVLASTLAKNPLILDVEGSFATLKHQISGKVINVRERAMQSKDNIPLATFTAFWDVIKSLKAGDHDLIGVDGAEYLFDGSFQYLQVHPELLGKAKGQFGGTSGTKFGWGYAKTELWPYIVKYLESLCDTVIFTSHPKDHIDKASGARTGRQTFRGADLFEHVSLALWLFKPTHEDPDGNKPGSQQHKGRYWALVKKNRLTWFYKQANGFPRQYPILPQKLILEQGQSYPELIWGYMNAPKPDYAELNVVHGDPTRIELSEEDKKAVESQHNESELELLRLKEEQAIGEEKNRLMREFVGKGKPYARPEELGAVIKGLGYADYMEMRQKLGSEAAYLKIKEVAFPESLLEQPPKPAVFGGVVTDVDKFAEGLRQAHEATKKGKGIEEALQIMQEASAPFTEAEKTDAGADQDVEPIYIAHSPAEQDVYEKQTPPAVDLNAYFGNGEPPPDDKPTGNVFGDVMKRAKKKETTAQ